MIKGRDLLKECNIIVDEDEHSFLAHGGVRLSSARGATSMVY